MTPVNLTQEELDISKAAENVLNNSESTPEDIEVAVDVFMDEIFIEAAGNGELL